MKYIFSDFCPSLRYSYKSDYVNDSLGSIQEKYSLH